jgi:hypothetical protein
MSLYMSRQFIDYEKKYKKYRQKYYDLIKKRLRNSVEPHQSHDFFFLTIPKGHPDAGKEVPVDEHLKNIILYFWKHGFITTGSDQGNDFRCPTSLNQCECFDSGFIVFGLEMVNGNATLPSLKQLLKKQFGKENIFILDESNRKPFTNKEQIKKYLKTSMKKRLDFFTKNPKKILLKIDDLISIEFRLRYIDWIHERLNIDPPDIEASYPGNLIPYIPSKN